MLRPGTDAFVESHSMLHQGHRIAFTCCFPHRLQERRELGALLGVEGTGDPPHGRFLDRAAHLKHLVDTFGETSVTKVPMRPQRRMRLSRSSLCSASRTDPWLLLVCAASSSSTSRIPGGVCAAENQLSDLARDLVDNSAVPAPANENVTGASRGGPVRCVAAEYSEEVLAVSLWPG